MATSFDASAEYLEPRPPFAAAAEAGGGIEALPVVSGAAGPAAAGAAPGDAPASPPASEEGKPRPPDGLWYLKKSGGNENASVTVELNFDDLVSPGKLAEARAHLDQQETEVVLDKLRELESRKQKFEFSVEALQLAKKSVQGAVGLGAGVKQKLYEGVDQVYGGQDGRQAFRASYGDTLLGGGRVRTRQDDFLSVQQELGAIGSETHSPQVRIQQTKQAIEHAWYCFTQNMMQPAKKKEQDEERKRKFEEWKEFTKQFIDEYVEEYASKQHPSQPAAQIQAASAGAKPRKKNITYDEAFFSKSFNAMTGYELQRLVHECDDNPHSIETVHKFCSSLQQSIERDATITLASGYPYERYGDLGKFKYTFDTLNDKDHYALYAQVGPFPDPQTIKDAEAHRLVDALRTRVEINVHLEAELDSLEFIELYRDLDDADKSGVPQPGTQNRSYRMMMGRARPPIVEFGAHGRWYLGSRATKRTQAIEMCFKCAESKAQIHAEEEIRGRRRKKREDDEEDSDEEGGLTTPTRRPPQRSAATAAKKTFGTERGSTSPGGNDDPTYSPEAGEAGSKITAFAAYSWWREHFDGWAVSTVAEGHVVHSAGVNVRSPLYLETIVPYLLHQHGCLWCPGRSMEDALKQAKNKAGADEEEQQEAANLRSGGAAAAAAPAAAGSDRPTRGQASGSNPVRLELEDIPQSARSVEESEQDRKRVRLLDARAERETKLQGALPDALDDSGQTQRLLRAMAVIDDQEGAIAAAMRLYVRTEHGAESLCVARNYTEVSPRFEVARATVLEAVRHLVRRPVVPDDLSPELLLCGLARRPEAVDEVIPGYDFDDEEFIAEAEFDVAIIKCRMFAPAMVAAGAIIAHERYSAGYSDPRGLKSATAQFERACSAIAGQLNKRNRRR